jgi:hypothetical protein
VFLTKSYESGNLVESLKQNGADFFVRSGVKYSKKNIVLSTYLEWFQIESDSKVSLETALQTWNSELGIKEEENKLKIKFEDNVMLDEIVFTFLKKTQTTTNNNNNNNTTASNNNNNIEAKKSVDVDGVHFGSLLSPRAALDNKAEKAKEEI